MKVGFQRRMALFAVCILAAGLLSGLLPYGNERAYAGNGGKIYTVVGTGDPGASGDLGDGTAAGANLYYPGAVAVDGGNLYIADTDHNMIRKVDASGNISIVAGTGDYGDSLGGGLALDAEMKSPSGVAVDTAGNVYIADTYNDRILKVEGGAISTFAGGGTDDSYFLGANVRPTDVELNWPGGVAVDDAGNVYIADTENHRILKVDTDRYITTVAGASDYGTFSGDGKLATEADLYRPSAVAVDSGGNLYIADTMNHRIRRVDAATKIISTVAGSGGYGYSAGGYSGDGVLATSTTLNQPEGIAVDGEGNLYIADTDNNRIRKVNHASRIISTIAGTGVNGYFGDEGQGIAAELDGPTGLAMDDSGSLYIADTFNDVIRMLTPYFPSSDAILSDIALSSGTLSPAFEPGTTAYTASVGNGVSSIRVTPTTADSLITVKVNGKSVASGTESTDIDLYVGENTITLVALAEDGVTTKTYTLTVERLRSSNANLSQLTLSNGTLSPAFASNTTSYTANASQSAITVTPTMADAMATVKVNGKTVANGTASLSIPLAVGSTAVTVDVTAQDGITTKTYTIDVTRTISANADLSGLMLSDGTLSPSFGAGTISYTASVGNSVSGIAVTPTVSDGSATVSVNDVPVASDAASPSLPLVVGSNTIKVKVTAENGTTKTYTVTVTRAASSNADLSDLALSSGALTPSFLPNTYEASVDNQVSGVTVTPTVSDAVHATVAVSLYNGSGTLISGPLPVASGTASPSLALGVGNNRIALLVTAEDGTTKTYTITVTRGASSNAELNDLTLSSGTLTPAFGGTYTASVGNSVSSVAVTATLSDAVNASIAASVYNSGGTLTSGPHALTSGEPSPSLPLSVGENVISVLVTAQDGSTRTYTVTVTRAAMSGSADLSGLVLSSGMLSPAFGAGTTSYTASVDNSVNGITATPTVADGSATVSVNDVTVASGAASASLPLIVGSNTITVKVTAENGATKTYTVTVTRAASGDADLSDLALSNGTPSPSFLPNTFEASVEHQISSVTITPTVSDPVHATVTVSLYNGSGMLISGPLSVASGTASPSLALGVGINTITLSVTAENGTTKTYMVTVTRGAGSNAELSNLTLSSGALIPAFGGTYTASVGSSVSGVTVTATWSDQATVTASVYHGDDMPVSGPHALTSGEPSPMLPLSAGENIISVLVTGQDGSIRTYTVTVTRAAMSGHADLSGLALSSGTLSPAFGAGTTSYTASVDNSVSGITATPTVADGSATVSVNDMPVASGATSASLPLAVGSNTITVKVTAENGATKTYTVAVTRAAPASGDNGGDGNDGDDEDDGDGGGGIGGSAPIIYIPADAKPYIDLNGQELDPADIDARQPFVTFEATPKDGVAFVSVPASILAELAFKNADFYLEIRTPFGSYRVPSNLASLIPELPDLLENNHLHPGDVSFKVTLTDKSGDKELQAAFAGSLPNGRVLGAMVDFHMDILNTKTGQPIGTADSFSEAITRVIPMPAKLAAMPEQWGAFRYNETAKKLEFVPARSERADGVWYVLIGSYSNSVYAVAENTASFGDVQDDYWGKPFIELAAAKGLVEGVDGGRYDPGKDVTRAEFAAMLVRALGQDASAVGTAKPYDDVNQAAWYYGAVAAAKELGLLGFVSGNDFKPNQPLTREEMASMLAAAIAMEELPVSNKWVNLDNYKDIGSVNASYVENVRLIVRLQIMTGTDADTFSPKGNTTRAQAAAVFIRTLQLLGMID